ncbi:MAG: response regulator [Chloroflexota bacterium]
MRIVYVEDNFPNRSLIERIAQGGRHQVVTYATAEDALYNLNDDQPDMLLVDVALAGPMTGLDLVRQVRAAGMTLPIVAITSVADKEDCLAAGCDAFFVKPIPVQDLYDLIEKYGLVG